jgi:hypothetical protein
VVSSLIVGAATKRYVLIFLSRKWRERDLQRRLEVWGPRVGARATTTYARGRYYIMVGVIACAVWAVVAIALQFAGLDGIPILVTVILFCPVILVGLVHGSRLMVRGMRQAAEVVATSNNVSVPMRWVGEYEKWIRENKHSRFSNKASGASP